MDPTIGFPREAPGERRTLLTPHTAQTLASAGYTVLAEPGITAGIYGTDRDLAEAGVQFADPDQVWAAPLVLRYKHPDPADLRRLRPGQTIGALFHAEGSADMLRALVDHGVTAYSYEFACEGGRFPLAVPGGRIAGIQAVLRGAQALQHPAGRGVLLAHIPGAPPARVLIIGSGNVAATAAQIAAALGAQVTVLAHTEASVRRYQPPPGVRVEINTHGALRDHLPTTDLLIGAILISTHTTRPMICADDLRLLPPGAVIVDATCGYGPGYLPTAGPVQELHDPPRLFDGILHVKVDALPAAVPLTATYAYTTTIAPYLARLAAAVFAGAADPLVDSACIARDGALVHPVCREHAALYGITP